MVTSVPHRRVDQSALSVQNVHKTKLALTRSVQILVPTLVALTLVARSSHTILYAAVHLGLLAIHSPDAIQRNLGSPLIHVYPHHVDLIQNVELLEIKLHVLACRTTSVECLIVDQNALSMLNVLAIQLVWMSDAKIHAKVHVVLMLYVWRSTIGQYVVVNKVLLEMHLEIVYKSLYHVSMTCCFMIKNKTIF